MPWPRAADDTRRLRRWAALLLAELLVGGALAAGFRLGGRVEEWGELGELARALELSALAFGSGAAYTRHPAQADRFAAWSDHPGAFEHLPAGSLIRPPEAPPVGPERRAEAAAEAAP